METNSKPQRLKILCASCPPQTFIAPGGCEVAGVFVLSGTRCSLQQVAVMTAAT